MILLGDWNTDFLSKRQATIPECKQLKALFKCLQFSQLIKDPTRITADSQSLIDLIATNNPQNIKDSGVISAGLSDHEMTFCMRKINWQKAPPQMKIFRNYAKYDRDDFCEDLKKIDFDCSMDNTDVNELWHSFKEKFTSVAERHAPTILKRVRGLNNCPWLNNSIKRQMRQRDFLLKKARKSGLQVDWTKYRSQRNRVNNLIKKEKENYNRRLIHENSRDVNSFWRTVKKIVPDKSKEASPTIKIDGVLSTNKSLIANAFNKFFVNTAASLCNSFAQAKTKVLACAFSTRANNSTFLFAQVSESTVLSEICRLKSGKAVGLDNIPPRLLKDAAGIICKPITAIINASLSQSKVLEDWKAAYVIPLYKKGKKGKTDNIDNYRPISILPVISKLLERTVHSQLVKYLQENHLLSPYQCGFRKQHSTTFAALSFADTIKRNIDQGLMTGAVFVDLRKAFDTIGHSLLLKKLSSIGIKGKELKWFEDYLKDRTQTVGVGGVSSDPLSITSGVPQGSILGPLLFVLHVNDLPHSIRHCNVLMYADDTVLFCAGQNTSVIQETLNQDLSNISAWLQDNSLFLNTTKTETMLFGTHAKLAKFKDFNININGLSIKRVYEFMYLGVIFDDTISWTSHIKYIVSRAGKRLGMLSRLRRNLTVHAANTLYLSFIRPIFDYCDSVWNCCGSVNASTIDNFQRRASKIVTRTKDSNIALNNLKWPTLQLRRDKHVFNLVQKCISGNCPQFFKEYFHFNRARVTRQNKFLHLPKVRTETAKKSFYYNGCIIYNKFIT